MEITNKAQLKLILENNYKNTCEYLGEKFDPEKMKKYISKKFIDFDKKLKPIIDKKFQFVGSENSIFDPIRKIEGVFYLDGTFYEVFKYKKGRKKYTSKINF